MSMMYMNPPTGPSLVGPGHAAQQQQPQQVHQATPSASYQEWLKAWKSWAGTRKRGKMAQFIVQKLEENKQAKWIDITIGKFELTEWHRIAEEWFKEKPRNSDQVDAPCMLRKGLPRAFPGLDEVKGESIKEGTQYRSRVFQAPAPLVQEVQLYVSKPSIMYPTSAVGPDMSSYSGHMAAMQMSSTAYAQTSNGPTGYNYVMAGGSMHSPSSIRMKPEPVVDPLDHIGGSPSSSDTASPYNYSNYDGLHNGGGATMVAPPMITDSPVAASDVISVGNGYHSPYNRGPSPYSMESTSPAHTQTTAYAQQQAAQQMLQVPTSAGVGEVDGWSNGSSHNSPRYSPDPTYPQDMSQQPLSPPMMVPQLSPGPNQQVLVDVKAYPDQSPLEGGGQLALLFSGQLPPGPKWLSFISQTRPEYVHQVEAIENNAIALTTIIPKHDIPETMNLQVVCGGRVIASTEFTYFANTQYHSDLLFQYLTQTFPTYFPDVGAGGMGGPMGPDGADGGYGGAGGGGYYGGNIPSTSYSLLLGACRLGIEPLIFATLELPSMAPISRAQLTKAKELAEEHGHLNAAKVLGILCELPTVTVKGGPAGQEATTEQILANEKSKEALQGLDNVKDNLKAAGQKILDHLAKIQKMEQRVKDQEERDSATSSPAHQPSIERSDSSSSETRRRHSANRLQRQDVSVREEDEPPQTASGGVDELTPPVQIHSRASISEQDDQLPPLRPTRSLKSRSAGGAMGQRKMLVASYSDAADSAVSMSFDHDLEQEMLRRGSASLVSSGLYSFNSSVSQQLLSITIQAQEGETFANGLQYECVYQVMEDFPPNSDSSNVVLKSGDRIIQVGDHLVRDKGPEDFAEILRTEASHGTTVKILPQLSSSTGGSTSVHSIASSIGYSSLDVAERKQLVRRQSDREMASSLTTKVTNLLTMKASIYPRSVTVPFVAGEGWGFEVTGGNAVGIFISKVSSSRKELLVGDQVLELGGQSTVGMSHYEATSILRSSKDKIQLRVAENTAKFTAIKDQFELESYYIRSHVDHTPSDSKDMPLKKGGIVRVVNTVLFPGYWLAWSVDPNTGMDLDLRRIPSPSAAKQLHGKDVYEAVSAPQPQNIAVS